MKIKACVHPEAERKGLGEDVLWCGICGARSVLGRPWESPRLVTDPRRHLVLDAAELPPHADRRAWETFAAAMVPSAVALVSPTADATENFRAVAQIAAQAADHLLNEWAVRFEPDEKKLTGTGGPG